LTSTTIGIATTLRFAVPLLSVIALIGIALSPAIQDVSERWFLRDVEQRSQLLYEAMKVPLERLMSEHDNARIAAFFTEISQDDQAVAFSLCDEKGRLLQSSRGLPPSFNCAAAAGTETPPAARVIGDGEPLLVTAFPLSAGSQRATLVVLHDTRSVNRNVGQIRLFMEIYMALLALAAIATTAFAAHRTLDVWRRSMRRGLIGDGPASDLSPEIVPIVKEARQLWREQDERSRPADDSRVEWTPNTLKLILQNELPDAEILIVSNREPYSHMQEENGIVLQTPASGLVSALEPILVACGGTWIAHGSGTADHVTVDQNDRLAVPPDQPAYNLRRVWLSEHELDGYYYGFANEGLWPLCHLAYVRPVFRDEDWHQYIAANRKFADAVVAEARSARPVVLVQDYHFALLPQMIKERLPAATIVSFWHIPWPNAEAFSICPWREELLLGMLGSSIMGFHTQFHCNNFLDTVDRFLETRIDRERLSIICQGMETLVRSYPISIEWPPKALIGQKPVAECRAEVRRRFGLPPDIRLAVGVERFDYTKGILDRMYALEMLLRNHPEWRGKFTLLQAVAPSREKLSAYQDLQNEAAALAEQINREFGAEVPAIILSVRHHDAHEVFELYRAADLCVVSSLHDGMNLVAKEFVAARDDEQGVLLLSTFAGASRELLEALIVNPYDRRGTAMALAQALEMSTEEQMQRMSPMRARVQEFNVYRWAGQILQDVAQMRRQQAIGDNDGNGRHG